MVLSPAFGQRTLGQAKLSQFHCNVFMTSTASNFSQESIILYPALLSSFFASMLPNFCDSIFLELLTLHILKSENCFSNKDLIS